MLAKIISQSSEKTVPCKQGDTVSDILERCGHVISKPCMGRGICGKCKIKVTGSISEPNDAEKQLLTQNELDKGFRLACSATITGNVEITLPETHESKILTDGISTAIYEKLPISDIHGYGAAIDIGTTTVAASFLKLPECEKVKTLCRINPQVQYGADVISRIEFALHSGSDKLQKAITECVDGILDDFGHNVDIKVITGNTTMLSLYKGVDVTSLSHAPFEVTEHFGKFYGKSEYLPYCTSAFVGADIFCAMLATNIINDSSACLIDLGTNGEMVYKQNNTIYCCSTSAGPAFEGAGITHGVTAQSGAIDRVYILGNKLGYTTIDNAAPIGLCSGGLIDAVACLLALGVIQKDGFMASPVEIGDSGVFVLPKDIRALQLAKSAVRAGIETLVPDLSHPKTFYLAGGFGSSVNIRNCVKIGLFPAEISSRIKVVGNASLAGAEIILQSRKSIGKFAENIKSIQLAANSDFSQRFIKYMDF